MASWYPVNLLVCRFLPRCSERDHAQIAEFRLSALLLAIPDPPDYIASGRTALRRHASDVSSTAIFLGGLIAPIMWSGLLYATLENH